MNHHPNFRIFIINAGVQPELLKFAEYLAVGELNFIYATSSGFSHESRLLRSHLLSTRMERLLKRRQIRIPKKNLSRSFFILELIHYLVRNRFPQVARYVLDFRNALLDIRCAALIFSLRPNVLLLTASFGTLSIRVARMRSTRVILSYPIAHHSWMQEYFENEIRENPTWARFLQGSNLSNRQISRLDREIFLSDEVLVGSNFVRKTFNESLKCEKPLKVLPLGADVRDLGSIAQWRDWNGSPFRIIFVGQLNQRKGLSYLLEGFKAADLGKSAQLTLVGGTTSGPSILEAISNYENVNVLPHVSRDELGRFLSTYHLFILPSLAEGFPLSAIEAMSCGIPVMISENSFGSDLIIDGSNGFLIAPRDAEIISNLIGELFSNRAKLEKCGNMGQLTAKEFTWGNYCEKLLAVVLELD